MPPATQTPPQNNDDLLRAIEALKTDLTTEIDKKLEIQQQVFEERLKPVDGIQQTLEQARQAQVKAQQGQQPAWQPKSWDEIPQMIDQRAQEIANKALEERERKAQQATERQTREERDLEEQIDRQLTDLEKSGYLPHVGNPNDYNDPGVSARRELLGAASHMGTPELDKVADTLTQLHKQNLVFNPQTKSYDSAVGTLTPLPGKFSPVGNSSQHSPSVNAGPSYNDIHNARDFDSLIALAEQRGYGPLPTTSNQQAPF